MFFNTLFESHDKNNAVKIIKTVIKSNHCDVIVHYILTNLPQSHDDVISYGVIMHSL